MVFDWDNTCIINDIGEAVFNYQLRELAFDLTPEELGRILVEGLPTAPFNPRWSNSEGQVLNVAVLAEDIVLSYGRLYQIIGNQADGRKEVKGTTVYQEFITKMRFLYEAIGDSFSAEISYPWVTYFLGGKTAEEIHKLMEATIREELVTALTYETWISPHQCASQSGNVSISFKRGIRLIPEIQQLMATFNEKGIDVYIVSASNKEVILPFADQSFGYHLSANHIYGMCLKEQGGKMLPKLASNVSQTQGEGKTLTIKKLIAPNYQNRGPLIVAGDSDGDVAMLSDFPDTKLALIIDRQKKGSVGKLVELGRHPSNQKQQRFFVQGRDEVTGRYLNAQTSIMLTQ